MASRQQSEYAINSVCQKSCGQSDVQSDADHNRSIYSRTSSDVRTNIRDIRARISRDPQLCCAACFAQSRSNRMVSTLEPVSGQVGLCFPGKMILGGRDRTAVTSVEAQCEKSRDQVAKPAEIITGLETPARRDDRSAETDSGAAIAGGFL